MKLREWVGGEITFHAKMKVLVGERAENARFKLKELIPITFDTELHTILKRVSKQFTL